MDNLPPNSVPGAIHTVFPVEKWRDFRILVAVSGGADSVGLLRGLHQLATAGDLLGSGTKANLVVGHVNHGIRGPDADEDARFVAELADQLGLDFRQVDWSVAADPDLATSRRRSEEELRQLRFRGLESMAAAAGARYVVTGHHRDDQLETILFRILRGTGLGGLSGIPTHRPLSETVTLVRPLLSVEPRQIRQFLDQLGQPFREDRTNQDPRYTRNFLRHQVIPVIESRFGEAWGEALLNLARQATEVQEHMAAETADLADAVLERHPESVRIDRTRLIGVPAILVQQFANELWQSQQWPRQAMTYGGWQTLAKQLVDPEARDRDLPGGIRLEFPVAGEALLARRNGAEVDNGRRN